MLTLPRNRLRKKIMPSTNQWHKKIIDKKPHGAVTDFPLLARFSERMNGHAVSAHC